MVQRVHLLLLPLALICCYTLHAQQKAVNAFYFASELVVDSKGNLFVSGKNNKIIKITPDGVAYHFAGHPRGQAQSKDGKGADAMFIGVKGLAIDEDDNIYVADYNTIRKVTPNGEVSTLYGSSNKNSLSDGNKHSASFYRVGAIAVDRKGTLYVTDETFDKEQKRTFQVIRKISPSGEVTTINNPDGSPFKSHFIEGLVCDKEGNLFVAKVAWSTAIVKIAPDGSITTVAGVYDENVRNRSYFKEGDLKTARIIKPKGLAFNGSGELVFSDSWISRILKISNNRVTVIAGGGGKSAEGANFMGGSGGGEHKDGKGKQALFYSPSGIAFDSYGNLFVVDVSSNSTIRKLAPDGTVTTFCKHEYNPVTKQFEGGIQKENTTVAISPNTDKAAKSPQTDLDRQIDSLLNDPKLKKIVKDAQSLNVDSIKLAAEAISRTSGLSKRDDDTTAIALPPKNLKALAKIPKDILSPEELQSYAAGLHKKLAPAFRAAYGTPSSGTEGHDATTVSNASVFATEAAHLDQAVLLALKAIEKSPDDPTVLNNAGAIFKKGGLEIAAVVVLEAANKKDPGNSTIQNNLGQAYLALGEKEKATQHLMKAVVKSPHHPLANSSLALISHAKGDRQSALKYVENSLRGAFTDRAWHLLYKIRRDAQLMKYFSHRYKQPEYFNEDRYRLPMQCEKVTDIPIRRAEYAAYREMVTKVKKQFDAIHKEEMEAATKSLMQRAKRGQIHPPPFMQLASAMMLDKKLEMDRGEWEKIGKSQKQYNDEIKRLQKEYQKKYGEVKGCGGQIALANEYMEKMSVVTRDYQKTYLRIYKDFYHDMTYWGFFAAPDNHSRRGGFCGQASALLGVLLQLAETHFLPVTIDCASNEELKREADELKIEGECPIGKDGYEVPFGIGKFNLSCEKWELQLGEGLIVNVGHKFTSGETTWALGPGVSFIGSGSHSLKKVPELKVGPITGGLDAGMKGQVFLTFRNGALMDWGGLFETELDLLGIAKEFKTGYTIGMNSGLQMVDGPLKNVIDKALGPDGEAPQINKNIKIYKPL